jgi:all-trans-8'-apo-beta-carotenal 15,15'-oxygenase
MPKVRRALHSSSAAAGRGPHDRLVRLDLARGTKVAVALGDDAYPSEPVIVPRGGAEDDGWILTLVYDPQAHASGVAILDGQRLEAGPVARAWFDHHVPPTFHGVWRPTKV